MGKVIANLGATRLPRQTVFGDRFVVECCESFHVHFRNLRLELGPEDFGRVMTALEETANTWRSHGQPAAHAHLELGRALVAGTEDPVFSVELCENLYKKWPTGWDARFHREDSFVHVHWRDMRLEMSNAEFLALAETTRTAHETLRAWKLKSLREIFELLDREGIIYAVIRNWEKLPDDAEVGPHSDLDLLVHPDHEERLDHVLDARRTIDDPDRVQRKIDVMTPAGPSFVLADIRVPGDGYFPDELAQLMLARRVRHRGFWVLSAEDHQLGLAYHVVHHKGFATGDYFVKLAWLSDHSALPQPEGSDCTRYAVSLLEEAEIPGLDADDPSVRPVLPLLHPRETIVTSRFLAMHAGQAVFSRVYIVGDGDERRVVKQTTGTFAAHEAAVLGMIEDSRVPRVTGYVDLGGHATLELEHIDGISLEEAEPVIRTWRFEDARRFASSFVELAGVLDASGVRHRDIRAENTLVRRGLPVLIDFGWAATGDHPLAEPDGEWLGGDARAPDGGPCDAYSIGYLLREHVVKFFPELSAIAQELVECRATDAPDWNAIRSRIVSLEEDRPDDPAARFLRLAELGRYDEARGARVHVEHVTEDVEFWTHHLERIETSETGERREHEEPESPPSAALTTSSLAARLVRERLQADDGVAAPEWMAMLVTAHLAGAAPPLSVVDATGEALEAFSDVVDMEVVAHAFRRAGRADEWLALRARQIVASGDDLARTAFLADVERSGQQPLVPAAAALATLYRRAGNDERAAALACFVVENDPYHASCAEIVALDTERRGEDAREAWRQLARLTPEEPEARIRARRCRRATARETTDPLPAVPAKLMAFLRDAVAGQRIGDALAAARCLAEISPDDPSGLSLVEKIEVLAEKKRGGEIRVVVDPLRDSTYEPDPELVRAELDALVRTPLGEHPIVRAAHAASGGSASTTARP